VLPKRVISSGSHHEDIAHRRTLMSKMPQSHGSALMRRYGWRYRSFLAAVRTGAIARGLRRIAASEHCRPAVSRSSWISACFRAPLHWLAFALGQGTARRICYGLSSDIEFLLLNRVGGSAVPSRPRYHWRHDEEACVEPSLPKNHRVNSASMRRLADVRYGSITTDSAWFCDVPPSRGNGHRDHWHLWARALVPSR
jgi:hypothetical protein